MIKPKKNNQVNHDTRKSRINYLRSENDNIFFDKDFNKFEFSTNHPKQQKDFNNLIKKDFENYKKLIQKDNSDFVISHNEEIEIHNSQKINEDNQLSKTQSSIQKNTKYSFSGLLTFSPTMKKDFENNKELFYKKLKQFIKDFEEKHNTKILYSSIHLDEKTPHIHFEILNYDFKNHNTLKRTFTKEDMSNFQDMGGNIFKDFGQGYHRGIKKKLQDQHN